MKSNRKATATIATTYATTSGVLDGDALCGVGDAHAEVDRDLERLVDLLPADHLDRIRRAGEQRTHRIVIDGVPFLLQPLDLRRLRTDLGRRLDCQHRGGDV